MSHVTNIVSEARKCGRAAVLFAKFGEWQHVEPLRARRDYLMCVARTAQAKLAGHRVQHASDCAVNRGSICDCMDQST